MLDNVINYNFPAKSKLFVHRVGKSSYTLSLGNNDNCNAQNPASEPAFRDRRA